MAVLKKWGIITHQKQHCFIKLTLSLQFYLFGMGDVEKLWGLKEKESEKKDGARKKRGRKRRRMRRRRRGIGGGGNG